MKVEDLKKCCDRLLDIGGSCFGYPNECSICEVPISVGFTIGDENEQSNSPDQNSRCVCDKCGYPHSFKSSGESGSGSGR